MSMRQRVQDVVRIGNKLFSNRYPAMSLWQTQAENFHVMRADFTRRRYFSEEFGSYLLSGAPARCHRDLADSFSTMLRRDQWFHAKTDSDKVNEDRDAKIWLDWVSKEMRLAMYDRRAKFVRAAKTVDKDFCAFGNGVMTREVVDFDHFLFRDWHLRDVAWGEDDKRDINTVHFNWNVEARNLVAKFGNSKTGTIAPEVVTLANRNDEAAFKEIQCRRMIIAADSYDLPAKVTRGMKWVSVYVDIDNNTILEETPLRNRPWTIPRWEFGSSMYGDQYGYSPPMVYGLPDGRMHQQIMLSLLTAAEMATFPPMAVVGEAINGAVNIYAGGFTQIDADYDERTGPAIRNALETKFEGIRYGADQLEKNKEGLDDSFMLSKIRFPQIDKDMTATEVNRLYGEFIRQSLPLFEPVEQEYSMSLCDGVFEDMLNHGRFGSIEDMPQSLRGRDISWQFDTPLKVAVEKALAGSFQEMVQVLIQGAQIDPTVRFNVDMNQSTRDAIGGTGAPAKWLLPTDQVQKMQADEKQQQAAAAAAQQVAQHADVATRVGNAAESAGKAATALQGAGVA
jgi:Bacteriophage head to tail connecting protein